MLCFIFKSKCFENQLFGPHIASPLSQSHVMWKNHESCKESSCSVLLVHIFQYFLIIWGRGEMNIIKIKGLTFTLWRRLWSQMKTNKELFGRSSFLYSPRENSKLHPKIYIPFSLHLSPLLWGWFFLHQPTYI